MSQAHWDAWYEDLGPDGVSWYQPTAAESLEMISSAGVDAGAAVIDVGGGASPLTAELWSRGWRDLTVLDLSAVAMEEAARALPPGAAVDWIAGNVLEWRPARRYGLWHDRAAFHFLVSLEDQTAYAARLRSALVLGGVAIVATFAPDGPEQCSGLPVTRWDASALADVLGVTLVASHRQVHTTPRGAAQPFTWIAGVAQGT